MLYRFALNIHLIIMTIAQFHFILILKTVNTHSEHYCKNIVITTAIRFMPSVANDSESISILRK